MQSEQRQQVAQVVNHRHLAIDVAAKGLIIYATTDKDRAHARTARALDVLAHAVADHHGLARRHAQQVQRRLEDARVRLEKAVL